MISRKNKKYKLFFCIVIILIVAVFAWIIVDHNITHKNVSSKNNKSSGVESFKNNVKNSTKNFTEGSKTNSTSQRVVGGSTNTGSQTITNTPSNSWTSSSSGLITLQEPINNATINDGAILYGTSKLSQIGYTLIDNKVGVISQGSLNVVNGIFSGKMIFTPQATTGRLDVYSTNAQGVQSNEIEINVNFK
jgi:hypothetical protein